MFNTRCWLISIFLLMSAGNSLVLAQPVPETKSQAPADDKDKAEPPPQATREDALRMLDALQKRLKSEAVLNRLQEWLKEQRGGQRCRLTAAKFEISPKQEIWLVLSGEVEFEFQKSAIADGARSLLIAEYGTLFGLTPPPRDAKEANNKPDADTKKPAAATVKPNDDPVPPPPPPPRTDKKPGTIKGALAKAKPTRPALPNGFPIPKLDDVKIKSPSASAFVAKLQASMKDKTEFHDCAISGARFIVSADDVDQLELSGQVAFEFQRRELAERAAKLLSDEFATSFAAPVEVQVPIPQVDSLKKVNASADSLLNEVRKRIAGKPLFDGCQITSGKYQSGAGNEDTLVLEGQVGFAFQKSALSEVCLEVLRDRYGTLLTAITPAPSPSLDQLKLVRPSAEPALARIQAALGQNPEWDGLQITQARYEDEQDRMILVVAGRLSEARLRPVAERVCESVMRETFASANGVFPVPKLDQLPVVKPSTREAVKAFNEGLDLYRKASYEAAGREFARAVFENPFQLSYKYWQVASEVAAGHDEQARRLLQPLILRRTRAASPNQADEYRDVIRRLEPVQGNVRQRMNRLEEELLRDAAVKKK